MNHEKHTLTAAEWNLMECLWHHAPCTARQAIDYLAQSAGWSRSTTLTMLRRMTGKGLISCQEGGEVRTYAPLVQREEAASLSRRDAEPACDGATIRRIGKDQRSPYGTALIETACAKSSTSGLPGIATMMTDCKTAIKERVIMIARKPKTAIYALIAVLLVTTITAGCTFSGAGNQDGSPSGGNTGATEDRKTDIEEAIYAGTSIPITWTHAVPGAHCAAYCGTYNGYDILYLNPHAVIAQYTPPLEIAGVSIHWATGSEIWGYQDGEFFVFSKMYEDGLLSDSDVAQIAEAINSYSCVDDRPVELPTDAADPAS